MQRREFIQSIAGLSMALAVPVVHAQESWPTRPVTLVVPYPPGGNTDFLARLTAEKLSEAIGKPFVVENRTGAAGMIAAEYAARQPGDGYTLFFTTITQISLARFLYKIRFDPIKDFVPIANVGGSPLVITVGSSKPWKTLSELVSYAKANPGKLTVGHAGVGSLSHLSATVFLTRAGIEATMVPYRGGGPALQGMMGGQTDMYSANTSEIMPQVNGGRVRFLGVSSLKRIKQLPDVPAIAETYPGHSVETWNGLVAPAGIAPGIVDRLADAVTKGLKSADMQAKLDAAGVVPLIGQTKEAFAQRIRDDIVQWKPVMEQANITPQ